MSLFFINLDIESAERFDMSKFFDFSDNYDPLTSDFALELLDLPKIATYVIQGEEARPELLSYNIFGSTQYWWILLLYNRLTDYRSIKVGDSIDVPDFDALEDLYFSLKAKETALTA